MKKIVLMRRRTLLPTALAALLLAAPSLVVAHTRIERISAYQADIQVTGQVVDDKGAGIPGVTVLVKGTTNGTSTDPDGRFSLTVPDNAVLTFSSIGFLSQEIVLGGRTSINVTMSVDTKTLDEVVVTGYQTQRKADLTGAVSVVKTEEIKDMASNDVTRNLQGRVPGVNITTDGAPGSSATVRIRA
ncbi:carboxypeptidase-like regulatory domain-containing protein [Hymenobacter qilianensis]|uniref:carboxypeptidase-like regulatory domain-containing protein n=1 Tax=Hymenobacter qilianensis TaxID=1385715 RepID=UPI0021CF11E0|nr:carboxypeptidase-like regulatory domain-containing protein [Hymenobacter qilianensis]